MPFLKRIITKQNRNFGCVRIDLNVSTLSFMYKCLQYDKQYFVSGEKVGKMTQVYD